MIRRVGERIATEDVDDLHELIKLDGELREAWRTAIDGLRRTGYTDREIGSVLGTSRQAVEQRWPREERQR